MDEAPSGGSVDLRPVELSEKPILRNLMELYLYDFSEFQPRDVGPHGVFGYRYLDHYWTDTDRFPFLIRSAGQLAGFALVRRAESGVMSISEFFVLRRYRRTGVGRSALEALFARFTGEWEIDVVAENVDGLVFWTRVLARYQPKSESIKEEDQSVTRFRLTVPSA